MNRKKRRRAASEDLDGGRRVDRAKEDQITAVHEAGHAIARILVAPEMGFQADELLTSMEFETDSEACASTDGKMMLRPQAVTSGPVFAKDMAEAQERIVASRRGQPSFTGRDAFELFREIIKEARSDGAAVERWLLARATIAAAGAAAESAFTKKPFTDVWGGYEAEDDVRGIIGECMAAGLETDHLNEIINQGIDRAYELLSQPEIGPALAALADELLRKRRLTGSEAIKAVEHAGVAIGRPAEPST